MPRTLYAGADLRELPHRQDDLWTPDRRSQYLLRPDVIRPLSLDRCVWGAVAGHQDPPLPWVTVSEVLERIPDTEPTNAWVALVIGIVAADATEEEAIGRTTGADMDLVVEPGWTFLGFDVADGNTSGLSNCGYDVAEMLELRRDWSPKLNDNGLFDEVPSALAFRELTDRRVPEHAPFRVYGLWLVAQGAQAGPNDDGR